MHVRSSQSMWRSMLQILLICCFLPATLAAKVQPEQTPEGLSKQEWSSIQQQVTISKHKTFEQEDGSYASANIANGWHIGYGADGRTSLTPYATEESDYYISLKLDSIGYGNQSEFSVPHKITSDKTKLTYQWDENVKEVWTNSSNRLEQWFEIQKRPHGATENQQLTLQMGLATNLLVTQNGNSLNFADRISYSKLKVWDSTATEIPASMHLQGNTLSLVIDDSLAVYPLIVDPSFQQQAYIKASNTDSNDQFGLSVAISGDTLVVAAPGEDSNATGQADNSVSNSGAVYVFTRTAGGWSQEAYLKASTIEASDAFGSSVAISGDTLVVGAVGEDSNATGVGGDETNNSAATSGAAYVFTRTAGVWSQQAYLKASNSEAGDVFGAAVAISGETLVVIARSEASNATGVGGDETNNSAVFSGAAYVFARTAGVWSQQAYIKASNTDSRDYFGASGVAISGDTLVVGASDEDSNATGINGNESDDSLPQAGAVYVFTRSAGVWSQQAYIKASNTGRSDLFGESVAISGDTLVVGAPGEGSNSTGVGGDQNDDSLFSSGATYVFIRTAGTWSQQAYIKASNTEEYDYFGISVAISGDTLAVGANSEDSNATGIDGNQADNSGSNSGAVYVFTRTAGVWSQQTYIKASNTGLQDGFGSSSSLSGDTLVVGVYAEDSNATGIDGNQADDSAVNAGAAYVFDTLEIVLLDQTITGFTATPSSGAVGGSSTLSAIASSGLTVIFDSNTPTICTVSGAIVSYLAIGTCTVTADQAGDATYNPAPQVTLDIGVGLLDQTITNFVATPASGVVNGSSALSATGGASGNPVVFGSSTPVVCAVAGSTVSYVTAGTCKVTADQAGNASYNAAPQETLDITVAKADQVITNLMATPASGVVNGSSALSATGGASGNPVVFDSSTPAVCTVAGSTLSYVTAGTCTVTVDQSGDANYNPAPQETLDITVGKADQAISGFTATPAAGVVAGSSTLSATASSGLTVTFASTTPAVCNVAGTTVNYLAVGTCTVSANQAGDVNYNAAPQLTLDISVGQAAQTITAFAASPGSGVFGGDAMLSATASSGLAVSYASITPAVCTVNGNMVSFIAVGVCTVTADQAGDDNYAAAPQVVLEINVTEQAVAIPMLSWAGLLAMLFTMLGIGVIVIRRKIPG